MKKLALLASLLLLGLAAGAASAQAPLGSYGFTTFPVVATTGQLGQYINFATGQATSPADFAGKAAAPSNYTLDWSYAGTAPSACTFQAEGSSDTVHWYALTAATSCTANNMFHVLSKPVLYFRINILTYTQGDSTTAITFHYVRGQ